MSMQSDTVFHLLARFMVEDASSKSVALASGSLLAQDWKDLRSAAGIFGYPTTKEAEVTLRAVLCEDTAARKALQKCVAVLSGSDMNKQALIDALKAAQEALK